MRAIVLLSLLAYAQARDLAPRALPAKGGWSLQMEIGGSCPAGTSTCFSDQTGVYSEFNRTGVDGTFSRGEECCPSGTTPRLDCGTYVNNGQPYACCPLGNADCRGDVEDPMRQGNELCANPGWALWQIPDGDFNMFCCLPNQYGYWYKYLGQDAVGMCSVSSTLPEGSTPGVQFNNGDGTVSPSGVQLSPLPSLTPTPAPTCDIIHYGWSLQVPTLGSCTPGSNLCPSGGSCCPSPLNCGTIIGDSEVPVCCPPGNPDCRGDVEGLWPQLCADSSWALWHVNTNGNHFCCLPDQIGYNVPNDNAAVGFCGSAVPNGTMRSILDYVGDGSSPGSFAHFPCDSSPAPNASYSSIVSGILNPPPTLNPFPHPTATNNPKYPNATYVQETEIIKQWISTKYVCPEGASETVAIVLQSHLSAGLEVTATKTLGPVVVTTEEGGAVRSVVSEGGFEVALGAIKTVGSGSEESVVTVLAGSVSVTGTMASIPLPSTSVFTGASGRASGEASFGVWVGGIVALLLLVKD